MRVFKSFYSVFQRLKYRFINLFRVLDQLVMTGLSLVLTLVFSNLLSKEEFVAYSLYYTIQSIVLVIFNSTFGQMLILEGREFQRKSVVSKNIVFSALIFLSVLLILLTGAIKIHGLDNTSIILFAVSIALFVYNELFRRYLYSIGGYNNALKLVGIISGILAVGLILTYIIHGQLTLHNFFKINVASFFIGGLWCNRLRIVNESQTELKVLGFRDIYHFSKWLILGIVLYIFSSRLFIFYLNSIGNYDEVIIFRLVETIFGTVLVFVAALENYYISAITKTRFRNIIQSISHVWIFLIGLIVAVSFVLEDLLNSIFGTQYDLDWELILLLTIAYIFHIISRALVICLRLNKLNKAIFVGNFVSAAILIFVLLLKLKLELHTIFSLKLLFAISAILTYSIFLYRNETKGINYSRLRTR